MKHGDTFCVSLDYWKIPRGSVITCYGFSHLFLMALLSHQDLEHKEKKQNDKYLSVHELKEKKEVIPGDYSLQEILHRNVSMIYKRPSVLIKWTIKVNEVGQE